MASQIAHIVYAKKYFDKIETGKADDDFLDEEKINQLHLRRAGSFISIVICGAMKFSMLRVFLN